MDVRPDTGPETGPSADPRPWKRKLLEVASTVGSAPLTKILLKAGVDFSSAGAAGRTPVYTAARNGHLEVLSLLVEAGADIAVSDDDRRTPLYVTAFDGHVRAAEFLLEHGADVSVARDNGKTPLNLAADGGHYGLVELFLASGGDIEGPDESGWTPLFSAADQGHVRVVKLLIGRGASASPRSDNGWTPLHSVCADGHTELAKLLLDHGADVSAQSDAGWTPFRQACADGHAEVAKLLISRGADVNRREGGGNTPLHSACYWGHLDTVRLLLDHGSSLSAMLDDGCTPLYSASEQGHLEVVRELLERGADVSVPGFRGGTPLCAAALHGHVEVARLLIERGADTAHREDDGWGLVHMASCAGHVDMIDILVVKGCDFDSTNDRGETPLHTASTDGRLEAVRRLIELGACVESATVDGVTPLMSASSKGHGETVTALLRRGASVQAADGGGQTPLMFASSQGHAGIVTALLERGASVQDADNRGGTPLHWASSTSNAGIVRALLEKGASVQAVNEGEETPLHWASLHGHVEVVSALLENGASVQAADKDGRTPLHWASLGGYVDTAAALLRNGASVSAVNADLRTPLHAACVRGCVGAASLLLANGADACTTDAYGDTPLSMAALGGHDEAFHLLVDSGADLLTRNKDGWSPLHHACSYGQGVVGIVETLLDKGAGIDETTTEELWTPLNLACRSGSADLAALLLDKGADARIANKVDAWPLHTASANGHVDVIHALLQRGVSPLDRDGRPVYIYASAFGHVEAVKALVEHCRSPDVPPPNPSGPTAVMLASLGGQAEVVRFLISEGFTTDAYDDTCATALHCAAQFGHADVVRILLENGATMKLNKNGFQPIHTAAAYGSREVIEVLLEDRADLISVRGGLGLTPLHLASEGGHAAVIEVLLEHGADVGAMAEYEFAPIHSASLGGHVEALRLLLAHGADAGVPKVDGWMPLHLASAGPHAAAVRLLLSSGACTRATEESGLTPLHVAARNGHVEVLEELLKAGADPNTADKIGQTSLFPSVAHGKTECAKKLLEHGADVSVKDNTGQMPIHWASDGGHVELVELLLQHGSNLSVGDVLGITPLLLATYRGHAQLVKLLIEKQADPEIARTDGRQPVDRDLFTPYVSMVDQEQRIGALGNDDAVSFIDREDDWVQIQYRLMDRVLTPRGPASATTGQALPLRPAPQEDPSSRDAAMAPGESRPALSGGSQAPVTKSSTLCDACSAALQLGVGRVAFDPMKNTQDLFWMVAGRGVRPGATTHGRAPQKSGFFYHHMSVHSLVSASSHGCYICRAVWDRLDARRRRLLFEADPLVASDGKYRDPLTVCMFFDLESALGDLGVEEPANKGLWAVLFSSKVHQMLDYGPSDITFFKFVRPQELKGFDAIGDLSVATNSIESVSFATAQLQNCARNHEECKRSTSEWLPSRLICLDGLENTGTIRLVLSQDVATPTQYCTLSHRWGTAEFINLTKENLESFCLGIPVSDLPKTFQDSFHVARKLGVHYIWIDSFCIVQDDPDDWFSEASRMHEIYSHSFCNICATAASDPSGGLFVSRDPSALRPCEAEIPWYEGGGIFRVIEVAMWDTHVLRAPLNMRAWVVQEHLFAPRHLHFGTRQIFWECLRCTAAEQFPDGLPACIRLDDKSLRRQLGRYAHAPSAVDGEQEKTLRAGWASIVGRYTRSGISLTQDRAIAFAGIVRRLEGVLGDRCEAGIWRSDIKRYLLWNIINCQQGDGTPARRPEAYQAPSFSWMSVEGAVMVGACQTDDSLARVLSMEVTESRGFITHGRVRLECTVKPVRLPRSKAKSGTMWLPRFRHGKPHLGWTLSLGSAALMDADRDYDDTYYCVLLAGEGEVNYVRGLVLEETGRARGEFRRIGYIQCVGEDKELLRMHTEDEDTMPCESYDTVKKMHVISIV